MRLLPQATTKRTTSRHILSKMTLHHCRGL